MNIRKCLIEINSLSPKSKAFLIMTLDLYYSNFNENTLGKSIEKIYQPYLLHRHSKHSNESSSLQKHKTTDDSNKTVKTQTNGRMGQQSTSSSTTNKMTTTATTKSVHSDRRSDRVLSSSVPPPRSPLKNSKSFQKSRRSEPIQNSVSTQNHYNHQNNQLQQKSSTSEKKISPKEIRSRQQVTKTSPRNDKITSSSSPSSSPSSSSSRELFKVESAIDKLQIKSSNRETKQTTSNETSPSSQSTPQPFSSHQVQDTNDENILKQQNTNGNGVKSKGVSGNNSKVYFKEENVENLSWNGETSFEFEDPECANGETSPRANQYSSSFLNFLSNN